jgi:hypothetical protein
MWRFWWDLKPGDVKGGLIGLIFLAIFLVAGFYAATPGENMAKRLGPGWECSNAKHGICIKRPAAKPF